LWSGDSCSTPMAVPPVRGRAQRAPARWPTPRRCHRTRRRSQSCGVGPADGPAEGVQCGQRLRDLPGREVSGNSSKPDTCRSFSSRPARLHEVHIAPFNVT
jgi:hypothetical protein